MLNVAACQATPLADTVLIVDTDVSIDANFVTRDGIPSLMSSTSKLWSLRDGVYLSPLQVSELMGFRGADFDAFEDGADNPIMLELLNASPHVASLGMALMIMVGMASAS